MAIKYYKTDSRRISYREYWNITSTLKGFLRASYNKLIGRQMNLTKGIPEPQSFRGKIIKSDEIPSDMLLKLNDGISQLKPLGFHDFWYYTSKESLMAGIAYGVQAMHESKKTIGKIIYSSYKSRQSFSFVFVSELADGTIRGTTNNRRRFNPPTGYLLVRHINTKTADLWELHQRQLAMFDAARNPARVFQDFDKMVEFENKTHRMNFEDKVSRGVWVEMTEDEVAECKAKIIEKAGFK